MLKQLVDKLSLTRLTAGLSQFSQLNPITLSEMLTDKLPDGLPGGGREGVRLRLLDVMLMFGIPFNRWLGLRIKELSPEATTIESPPSVLRRNHVGTVHACAQALIGEFAAGLLIAQTFSTTEYRIIIGKLEVEYQKAGRGTLAGRALAPATWPSVENGSAWIDMKTEITDRSGETVSTCRTRWQIKTWEQIAKDRAQRKS